MTEAEKTTAALLQDAKSAFLKKDWSDLERICELLKEVSQSLSQVQKEKLVWYFNQTREDLQ